MATTFPRTVISVASPLMASAKILEKLRLACVEVTFFITNPNVVISLHSITCGRNQCHHAPVRKTGNSPFWLELHCGEVEIHAKAWISGGGLVVSIERPPPQPLPARGRGRDEGNLLLHRLGGVRHDTGPGAFRLLGDHRIGTALHQRVHRAFGGGHIQRAVGTFGELVDFLDHGGLVAFGL